MSNNKPEKKVNPGKSKFEKSVPRFALCRKIIKTVVLSVAYAALLIFITDLMIQRTDIGFDLDRLSTATSNVLIEDESLYRDCSSQDKYAVHIDLLNLNTDVTTLITQRGMVGKVIPVQTYCALHELIIYNDMLRSTDLSICRSETLKNKQELDVWGNGILKNVADVRKKFRELMPAFKEYFLRDRTKQYSPQDCQNLT